jgi:DNA-binding MarR family transcriptional regulator
MHEARWLNPTEQRAWRGFLDLHAELSARLNQDLQRTSGLSLADYDVLVHLTDVPDARRRPGELAESLQWEKSRLSKQVARMRARGLLIREECESDRRGFYVVLTARGRRAIEDAAPAHVEQVRRLMLDALSDAQVAGLAKSLTRVLTHLHSQS